MLACTDAGLQPVPPPPPEVQDDRLRIVGEVCTEPADVTPFPVKILFAIDQSASLQCTDSRNRRFDALGQVINTLSPLPNVSFAFVGFASWSRKQGFTRNTDEIRPFLDPAGGLGPATDYQGALATSVRMLEEDMVAVGPAERARTRYVVVFMSDGNPEPRCRAGCEDDLSRCGDGVDNDQDGLTDAEDPDCEGVGDNAARPDSLYGVCNTDREIPEGTYVDMSGRCPEYNMPRQVLQRVDDLRALDQTYAVGDIRLHTVLLFSEPEVVASLCPDFTAAFGYDPTQAAALLEGMAQAGGGTFRDVNLEDQDDSFLDFDFTSLRAPYFATEFVARNLSTVPGPDGPRPDTDRDGLGDAEEAELGTRRTAVDSDADPQSGEGGDRWPDLIEARRANDGFDPTRASVPALPCDETEDLDGDGLLDCEERFLGTDPRVPDTDGDRILDGDELRTGTDPVRDDGDDDRDFDGVVNRDEIRAGRDPDVADPATGSGGGIRYDLTDKGEVPVPDAESGEPVLRRCYDFDVSDVRLAVTEEPRARGLNRILLHVMGQPLGVARTRSVVRTACFEAFYPGEGIKQPASGVIDVGAEAWEGVRASLEDHLAAVGTCADPTGTIPWDRPGLEEIINRCLPPKVQLGRILYPREELIFTMRRYVNRELRLRLPAVASDLFVPIAEFDPGAHCHRPVEIRRLEDFLTHLEAECAACLAPEAADGGLP